MMLRPELPGVKAAGYAKSLMSIVTISNAMCSVYSRPVWQGFGVAKVGNVAGVAG
jgi:hypothetical protein